MVKSKKARIGNGLFSKKNVKSGELVAKVKGKIVTDIDEENCNYIDFGDEETFYPFLPYRHINHSCDPNCMFVLEYDGEKKRLVIQAIKEIKVGDELFTDYGWSADSAIPCECKTPDCRGWIVNTEEQHLVETEAVGA